MGNFGIGIDILDDNFFFLRIMWWGSWENYVYK